jgi:uncharacterized protein (TIGR02268 family)
MPAVPALPVLLLALLEAPPPVVPAQGGDAGMRRIELTADAPATGHEVRIRPGYVTTLLFDTPVQRGTVKLAGEERFHVATLGEDARAYLLLPSAQVQVGERLSLALSFADGAAPERASFLLVVHSGPPETQVNVYRQPRTLDSYRQESGEQRQRAEQCEGRLTQVLASQGQEGLTGLEAGGLLGQGITSQDIFTTLTQHPHNAFTLRAAYSFRAMTRGAVRLKLVNTRPQPWEVAGAELVSASGVPLEVLKVWQAQPLHAGLEEGTTVLVEVELPVEGGQGPHALKLWSAGEARSLVFGHVTFPPLPEFLLPEEKAPEGKGGEGGANRP